MQSSRPVIRFCNTFALLRPAPRPLSRHVTFVDRYAFHASAQACLPKKKTTSKHDLGDVRLFEQEREGDAPRPIDSLKGDALMDELK